MSTETIAVKDIKPGMIIVDDMDVKVVVENSFGQTGEGLGIVVNGRDIASARNYSRRFPDVEETVERVISGDGRDTLEPFPEDEDLSGQVENNDD